MELSPLPLVVIAAVLLAALGLVAACCLRLLTDRGRLLLRIEELEANAGTATGPRAGLPAGSVPNDFDLPLLAGGRTTLSQWRGRSVLLLFVNPACAASRRLLTDLGRRASDGGTGRRTLLVVSTGTSQTNRRLAAEAGITAPVLLQEGWEVGSFARVDATPAAYAIDDWGRTEGGLALGAAAVLALARAAPAPDDGADDRGPAPAAVTPAPAEEPVDRDGLPPGAAAPDVRVPLLDGVDWSATDQRGQPVLVVFWEPGCPACDGLLPDLARAQRRLPVARVVVIARGDLATIRRQADAAGRDLAIGVQRRREVSLAFATFDAPAAYLLDPDGTVAAGVAVGADRVRALAARLGDGTAHGQARPAGRPLGATAATAEAAYGG